MQNFRTFLLLFFILILVFLSFGCKSFPKSFLTGTEVLYVGHQSLQKDYNELRELIFQCLNTENQELYKKILQKEQVFKQNLEHERAAIQKQLETVKESYHGKD